MGEWQDGEPTCLLLCFMKENISLTFQQFGVILDLRKLLNTSWKPSLNFA